MTFESFWRSHGANAMQLIIAGVKEYDPREGMRQAVEKIWTVWNEERRALDRREEDELENRLRSERFAIPDLSPAREAFLFGFKRGQYYKELVGILRLQVEKLERGLAFYAKGEHYELGAVGGCEAHDPIEGWETVSGEPGNWLCPPDVATIDLPWMVENGGFARMVLDGEWNGWTPIGDPPPENTLVVARWDHAEKVVGGGTYQVVQVAFHDGGIWYAWHYGSFASRLVDPVAWVLIGADTSKALIDARHE